MGKKKLEKKIARLEAHVCRLERDLALLKEIIRNAEKSGNPNRGGTGYRNSGNGNSGNRNSGHWNSGNCNSGTRNSGIGNSGSHNSGDRNSGDYNSGNGNSGDCNSGDYNSGNGNSGDCNSGNCNSGSWNSGRFSNGCFNTVTPKIYLFDKPSEWTYLDWLNSEARHLLLQIPHEAVQYIRFEKMTDEEKAAHPEAETTGGYLKERDLAECAVIWWKGLSDKDKAVITSMPNFDRAIFKAITGTDADGAGAVEGGPDEAEE